MWSGDASELCNEITSFSCVCSCFYSFESHMFRNLAFINGSLIVGVFSRLDTRYSIR